ncbi:MAG TPA: GIY-YIG nuclease family protein [Stellaceae bacterium]|nr:GIY-YIG nuclease family protein [Stellaceae bacterium]
MAKAFFVYLLASQVRGTLYVGVTSNLPKRVWEHKIKAVPGFTSRHGVDRLVWFEAHEAAESAIRREKQIKEWKRDWKINLIERDPVLDRPLSDPRSRLNHQPVVPAQAGTHAGHGHRPSPV